MNITIYTKELSADLIPAIKKRFADFQMKVDFHPAFKFDEQADAGFLPVRLQVLPGLSRQYNSIDHEIMSGFEIYFSNYDFAADLSTMQQQALQSEKKSFLSKLFNRSKTPIENENNFVAGKELDQLLKNCQKIIMINWKPWSKCDLRISLFFAAILAELANGVVYEPQSGRYLGAAEALQTFPLEIEDYEQSFTDQEFTVEKFEGWR